ncbi:MAG: Do family serine endopeptidase [Pseudomonadota bacterium]
MTSSRTCDPHSVSQPSRPHAGAVAPRSLSAALVLFAACLALTLTALTPAHARGPVTVAPVAEKLLDSVVNISTSQAVKGPKGAPLPRVPEGSPFEDFFKDFFSRRGRQQGRKVSSLGSGFVIDPSGIIVTNNHVIEGADEIIINFRDGTKLKVDKVLGTDKETDLAVLKVTPKKPLKAVKFGSSANIKVGDWVMAIGNPFGLGGTVTVGIISAKQRDINSGRYDDFLQTDASINKGNSGGPLFNMDGDVIGVNTAIISPGGGGSIGIGFAVPADTAIHIVQQLRDYGETRRGWLGVKIQTVTDDLAESLGVEANRGALISEVTRGGPAEAAGLKARDVIITFDGKPVRAMRTLPRLVAQTRIGKSVEVKVRRDGKDVTLNVRIARLQEGNRPVKKPGAGAATPPSVELLGLSLTPLTPALRSKYNLKADLNGVVVTKVDPSAAAASKNIKVGDVIVEAAQRPVKTVKDISAGIERMKSLGRGAILLQVENAKGDLRFVAVPIK